MTKPRLVDGIVVIPSNTPELESKYNNTRRKLAKSSSVNVITPKHSSYLAQNKVIPKTDLTNITVMEEENPEKEPEGKRVFHKGKIFKVTDKGIFFFGTTEKGE